MVNYPINYGERGIGWGWVGGWVGGGWGRVGLWLDRYPHNVYHGPAHVRRVLLRFVALAFLFARRICCAFRVDIWRIMDFMGRTRLSIVLSCRSATNTTHRGSLMFQSHQFQRRPSLFSKFLDLPHTIPPHRQTAPTCET